MVEDGDGWNLVVRNPSRAMKVWRPDSEKVAMNNGDGMTPMVSGTGTTSIMVRICV
jgi:hypothetical protein